MEEFKQLTILKAHQGLWQLLLNLTGQSEDPTELSGRALDLDNFVEGDENMREHCKFVSARYSVHTAFWSGSYEKAVGHIFDNGLHNGHYEKVFLGFYNLIPLYYHCALTLSTVLRNDPKKDKRKRLSAAMFFANRIFFWAKNGVSSWLILTASLKASVHLPLDLKSQNPNVQHYALMIKGDLDILRHQGVNAAQFYKDAIESSTRCGFINDQALAHERLGEYLLDNGDEKDAEFHLAEAIRLHGEWGAHTRCELLRQKHPEFLATSLVVRINQDAVEQ